MSTTKVTTVALGLLLGVSVIIGGIAYSRNNAQIAELRDKVQELAAGKASLEKDKSSLEQENAALRETPDFYYKHGVELQSSGDLPGARDAFDAVVSKFQTSPLVAHARLQVGSLDNLIARAEADAEAEEARKQAEQEAENRERGEPIDYDSFYAKVNSTGLPIGKRFRFIADIETALLTMHDPAVTSGFSKTIVGEPAFDDQAQYEAFLRGNNTKSRTIVASMGSDRQVQIHRIE